MGVAAGGRGRTARAPCARRTAATAARASGQTCARVSGDTRVGRAAADCLQSPCLVQVPGARLRPATPPASTEGGAWRPSPAAAPRGAQGDSARSVSTDTET